MDTKHLQVRSEVSGEQHQNAHRLEDLQHGPICGRCGKPMKLVRRFKSGGTRQVWYCNLCFVFRIVQLVQYTVGD